MEESFESYFVFFVPRSTATFTLHFPGAPVTEIKVPVGTTDLSSREVVRLTNQPGKIMPVESSASFKYWTNSLGMVFVHVAGTSVRFSVWDTRVQDYRAYAAANPDTCTNDDWRNTGFEQSDTHPVVNVSWNDAKAFCAWLSRKEGLTYRLPTDAEWSVAVGLDAEPGSTPKEKSGNIKGVYPWGTNWPPPSGAGNYDPLFGVDNFTNTSPVGNFAANQYGLYDMGGNVWQWCEDWYDGDQVYRVLRGASWHGPYPALLLSSYRLYYTPDAGGHAVGFRCVLLDPSRPEAR
jgi:hypothetical protein